MWTKVSESFPKERTPILVKCKGAFMRSIFIFDEERRPVFLHFFRNDAMTELNEVTEWKYHSPKY